METLSLESKAGKLFHQSLDSYDSGSWNFPDFSSSEKFDASGLVDKGLLAGIGAVSSYAITIGTRLKMNKILGGKHTVDDHALVGVRSLRTGLLSGGGELAGGIMGYNIASQALLNEDDHIVKKIAVKGLGTMAGGALGHMANTYISMLNGAYLGYKLTDNIVDTRSKFKKLLGGVAGVGAGFVAAQIPFGQAVMNVAGFGAVDVLSDRKEAKEYGIGGITRGKYFAGKSFKGVNFEMKDKLQMGTFVDDVLNSSEISQLESSLGGVLTRLHNTDNKDEQDEILENIQKFLPVSYSEISEVPHSVEQLLQDSAITVYRNRKKWEKSGKSSDLLPTPTEIIQNAHTLSYYLSVGSEPTESEINDFLDETHLNYWGMDRTLRPLILNDSNIKNYILSLFSDTGITTLYERLHPSVTPLPSISEINTQMKAKEGEEIFQKLGTRNKISVLRILKRDKEEEIKNIIIEEESKKLQTHSSYRSRLIDFSDISKFVRDSESEEDDDSGNFFAKLVTTIKTDTTGSIIKALSAKEMWDNLPTGVKNSIKNLNPFKKK